MPIIRKRLKASDVYPDDIRYNADTDKVQSLIDDTWVDNPDADPRNQTTFPPRITSNPACDAAESVKDAFKGQITSILGAIEGAATAFSIAGLILGLFTFGVFEIFISLALAAANAMIAAGSSALGDALTDPVWHQFACILNCHMNASGRVKPGEFSAIVSDVDSQIGGLAALVINAFLQIAGEGGVNNLASLGSSTGSCDDCDDCGIACGSADLVTLGTVVAEYIEDGRKVLRVQSEIFHHPTLGDFWIVSIGNYGEGAGTYPCCHIFAWTHFSGSPVVTTGYTNCAGGVADHGNPETHDVASAYWSSGVGGGSHVVNIVFGA